MEEKEKQAGFFCKLKAFIDRLSLLSAKAVAVLLMVMMCFTCLDVFLRFFLGKSIVGTVEIEGNYFMVAIIFLPLAYGMISHQGHIRVEILTSHLSALLKRWVEVLGWVLSLSVFGLVTVYGFAGAWHSWRAGETMVNIGLPIWPGRLMVAVGGLLLGLQMVLKLVQLFKRSQETSSSAQTGGPCSSRSSRS